MISKDLMLSKVKNLAEEAIENGYYPLGILLYMVSKPQDNQEIGLFMDEFLKRSLKLIFKNGKEDADKKA